MKLENGVSIKFIKPWKSVGWFLWTQYQWLSCSTFGIIEIIILVSFSEILQFLYQTFRSHNQTRCKCFQAQSFVVAESGCASLGVDNDHKNWRHTFWKVTSTLKNGSLYDLHLDGFDVKLVCEWESNSLEVLDRYRQGDSILSIFCAWSNIYWSLSIKTIFLTWHSTQHWCFLYMQWIEICSMKLWLLGMKA